MLPFVFAQSLPLLQILLDKYFQFLSEDSHLVLARRDHLNLMQLDNGKWKIGPYYWGILRSGGEVFMLDMGEAVLILDLAERMIRLSGRQPGTVSPRSTPSVA